MSFKGSNGVAAERRVDLASLFCMIGRHGPAVALAVFAMVSVLAGFVIYRTVRGRRRGRKKATPGEGESTPGETDEAVTQAGGEPQACATSTDDGDVAKEEDDPTGTHLQVRRRAAAVVKSLSPSDVQAPLKQHAPSSQRVEPVPTSFTEARLYLEEPSQSSVAEIQAEPATVCHLYATEDSLKDEEISEVSLKELESGQAHIEHEEGYYAECQEGEDVSTNDTTQAEENDQPSAEQDNEIVAETGTVELGDDEVIHHQDGADPNENDHLAEEEEKHNEELEKEFDGNITLTDEATVAFDAQSLQVEHPEIQAEPKEEHNLTRNQEMDLITDGGLGESSDIVSNSSSVPPILGDDTSDPTTPIDSDMSTNDQEAEKVDVPTLEDETENLSATTAEAEEPVEPLREPWSSPEAQESFPELDIEVIPDGNNEDPNGDDTKKSTKSKFESVGGKDELSHEDIESSSQDQQNDQNLDEDSFVFAAPPPIVTKDPTNPPELRVCLPLFEPSELRDDNVSGGGEESGISSMAVSPELPDPSSNFDIIEMPATDHESPTEASLELQACLLLNDTTPSILEEEAEVYEPHPPPLPEQLDPSSNFDTVEMPATDHESPTEASLEPQACHLLDDTTPSVLEEEAEVYEPHPPPLPEQICSWNVKSSAKNKDTIGHVNDNQRETVPVQNDEWERQVDVKVVEVSCENEKLESAENKEPQMENDVKTEINIMEATMDHNEWITDGNPTFPWMNLSTPTFGGESQQLPTQETNYPDSEPQSVPPVKQTDNSEENRKSQKANVTFRVHYITRSPFQMLAVTGNRRELGNWKSFVPLEDTKDGYWSAVVSLPAQNHVQWKFVVVEKGEMRRWEECRNRLLDTGCGEDLLVHKLWGYL
ncbi:microtubule-associated protein futsch isoform X1 [Syngnathus typhle]|uniref:microtubule-associated protein futsch isoform X1 n=1 Tax=Syngnathus typhle TaxID=161592 RepID=UPI002A6A53A0|nr:microtubule-associated protein futsch isoform X1 [Syngnathus typhle]